MNHQPKPSYFSKSRVEAFSDGIFAILVTLLVLEIKVPEIHEANSSDELMVALTHLIPKIVSWIVSFLILCVVWVNHHRMLDQLNSISHGVFWLNANLMLWCSFVPFPTALMGDYIQNPAALSAFGVVLSLVALSFTIMRYQILHDPALLKEHVDKRHFRKATTRSLIFGPMLYLAGAACALASPYLALIIYLFIPIYFIFFNTTNNH